MVRLCKKRSRISEKKFREILRLFLLDIEAIKVSEITKISRSTINKIFMQICEIISKDCDELSILETGRIDTRRVKGNSIVKINLL